MTLAFAPGELTVSGNELQLAVGALGAGGAGSGLEPGVQLASTLAQAALGVGIGVGVGVGVGVGAGVLGGAELGGDGCEGCEGCVGCCATWRALLQPKSNAMRETHPTRRTRTKGRMGHRVSRS